MKLLPVFMFFLLSFKLCAQSEEVELEGIVVDSTSIPVADAYIINFRTQEKSVSKSNGVFKVSVLHEDSLAIIHVAYSRKIIRVFDLARNPVVKLDTDNIKIKQVNVSANYKTDYERAMQNIASISDVQLYRNSKRDNNPEPTMEMMIQNNRVMRTEAASVRILRFSPSEQIKKFLNKIKKKEQ